MSEQIDVVERITVIDGHLVMLAPEPICKECSLEVFEVTPARTLVCYCEHAGRGASLPLIYGMSWRIHPPTSKDDFFTQAASISLALTPLPGCVN